MHEARDDVDHFTKQIAGIGQQTQQYQQQLDQLQQQYDSLDDWYKRDITGQQLSYEISGVQFGISNNQKVLAQYEQALAETQNQLAILEKKEQTESEINEKMRYEDETSSGSIDGIVSDFLRYGEEFYNSALLELSNALSTLRGRGRPKNVKPLDFLETATPEELTQLGESAQKILESHRDSMDELDLLQIESPEAYRDSEQIIQDENKKKALQSYRNKANNRINAYVADAVLSASGQVAGNAKEKKEAIKAVFQDLKSSSPEDQARFVENVVSQIIQGTDAEEWYQTSEDLGEFGTVSPRDAFDDYRGDQLVSKIEGKLRNAMKRDNNSIIPGRDEKMKLIRRLYTRKPETAYNPANEELEDDERQQYESWRVQMTELAEIAKARFNNQMGRQELTASESYNLSNNLTVDLFRKWQKKDKPRVPGPPSREEVAAELQDRGIDPTDSNVETQLRINMREWENEFGEAFKEQQSESEPLSLVGPDSSPGLVQNLPLEGDVIPQYEERLIAEGFSPEEAREIAIEGFKGRLLNHVAEMIDQDPDLVEGVRGFGRQLNSILKLAPQGLKNPLTGEDLTRPAAGKSAGTEIFFDMLEKSADPDYESGLFYPGRIRKQVDYILRGIDDEGVKARLADDPMLQKKLAYEALKRFVIYSGFNFKREIFRQMGKAKRDVGMYMERERDDLDFPDDIDMGSVGGGFTMQLIEEMGDGDFQDLLAVTSNGFDTRGPAAGRLDTPSPDDDSVEPQTAISDIDGETDPFEQKKGLVADFVLARKGPLEQELWKILYDEDDDSAYLWRRTRGGKALEIPTYQLDSNGSPKVNWKYVTKQLLERGVIEDEREIDELTGVEFGENPEDALKSLHRGLVKEVKNAFQRSDDEIQKGIRINDLRRTEQGITPDEKKKKPSLTDRVRKERGVTPRRKTPRLKKWVQTPEGVKKEITEGTSDWDKYKDSPEIPNPDPRRRKKKLEDPTGPKTTERPTERATEQRTPQEQGIGRFTKRIARLRKLMKWNG